MRPLFGPPIMIAKDVMPDGKQVLHIPGPFPLLIRVILNPAELHRVMRLKKLADRVREVELTVGPIDAVLGQYNFALDKLDIDGLETILLAAMKDPRPEALDRAVTEVTAHEARHVWQQRRFGWWGRIDKFVIPVAIIALAWWYLVWPALHTGFEMLNSGTARGLLGIPMMLAGFILWRSSLYFARVAGYRWSWAERDARAFARRAKEDPDWQDVIQVDMGIPVPVEADDHPPAA